MRHLVSVIVSLVLAPLIYAGAGYGAAKFAAADAQANPKLGPVLLGLLAAAVAGTLYALLVMARISPLGPALAGLAFLGVTLWAMLDRDGFRGTMPASLLGERGALVLPAGALTGLLVVPLLITIGSPRRWRRTELPGPTGYAAYTPPIYTPPEYSPAGSAAPAYPTSDPVTTTWSPPTFNLPTPRAEAAVEAEDD